MTRLRNEDALEQWLKLAEREAAGESLTAEERRILAERDDLRRDATLDGQLASLMRFDNEPPGGALDQISERSLINQILERADQHPTHTVAAPTRTYTPILALAAALLLVVGGALLLRPTTPSSSPDVRPPAVTQALETHVLLVAGEAYHGAAALDPGEALHAGSQVIVDKGALILEGHRAIRWRLLDHSAMELIRLDTAEVELQLLRGTLQAVVDPAIPHPTLRIHTPHGVVEVTGTVFSLHVSHRQTLLDVYRGHVRANTQRTSVDVGAGQRLVLGEDKPESREGHALPPWVDTLAQLQGDHATSLLVSTTPRGARVFANDVALGETPLRALMPPGATELRLNLEGHVALKEIVTLRKGASITRRLTLDPVQVVDAGPAADEEPVPPPVTPQAHTPAGALPQVVEAESNDPLPDASAGAPDPTPKANVAARPPHRRETPDQLLKAAMRHRYAKAWNKAERGFRRLLKKFPTSPEAHVVRVSYGQLLLDRRNQPRAALKLFEAYINRGGPLIEEARLGRIEALRRMGRSSAEQNAIEAFLKAHPRSLKASALQKRLSTLTSPREGDTTP